MDYMFPAISKCIYKGFNFLVARCSGLYNAMNKAAGDTNMIPLKLTVTKKIDRLIMDYQPDRIVVAFRCARNIFQPIRECAAAPCRCIPISRILLLMRNGLPLRQTAILWAILRQRTRCSPKACRRIELRSAEFRCYSVFSKGYLKENAAGPSAGRNRFSSWAAVLGCFRHQRIFFRSSMSRRTLKLRLYAAIIKNCWIRFR